MNERIEQLFKQAGFCGTGFCNTLPGTTQEDALKNFAELIVRECIERVRSQYVPLRDTTTPFANNPFPNLTVRTPYENGIIECGVNSVVALEELIQEQIEKWYNENLKEADDE